MEIGNPSKESSGCLISQKAKPIFPKWQIELLSSFFFLSKLKLFVSTVRSWFNLQQRIFQNTSFLEIKHRRVKTLKWYLT